MRKLPFTVLFFVYLCGVNAFSSYDLCKDILRDGVKDIISTHDTVDKKLAAHNQFCSISKENNLNENNFHKFAKDYAKAVQSSDNSYGGGAGVSVGPFSFNGHYGQTNSNQNLSSEEKEDLLKRNSRQIIDYYNKNCGQSSFEDFLKTEAVLLSKIANPNIVQAWRECMLNNSGFFADLVSSPFVGDEKEIDYNIMVRWKSNEGTEITSIEMRYIHDKISTPYQAITEANGFIKTRNLCETEGCTLRSGSNIPFSVIHKNAKTNAAINIIAKTNTGVIKSHVLLLPRLILPEPPKIAIEPRFKHTDEEMRRMMRQAQATSTRHSDEEMFRMMGKTFQ